MPNKEAAKWKVWEIMQEKEARNIEDSSLLSNKKYKLFGILIVFFALLIRLLDLGDRVFHHDESVHASFTLKLLETGQYKYNPAYHGPFLFHTTAVVFRYLGTNDATARLIPVLFGIATLLLIFLLKDELGKRGVLWSAFLLAFSPSMVYFSRFFRNDMIIVFCTLATVVGVTRYLDNLESSKRYGYLTLAAASLAVAVSSKENAYLIILIFGAYSGIYLLYRFYFEWQQEKNTLKEAISAKKCAISPFLPEILAAGVIFIFIVMFFYTSVFRYHETIFSIVGRAFAHWMEMHRIERIGGPFYYYIPILLVYEIPILLFGITGIIYFLKKRDKNTPFFLFLSYWAVTSLLLYSYLQEKVPWLVVHIVLPFGLLAGAFIGEKISLPGKIQQKNPSDTEDKNFALKEKITYNGGQSKIKILLAGILALTLIVSLAQCISVNFYRSMEDDELMTYTQASPDIRELILKLEGFKGESENLNMYVIDPNDLYWPLPWYFRDYEKVSYADKPPMSSKYKAIIVPSEYQMYRELPKEEYDTYNFTLRPGKEFTLYYNKKLERN